MVLASSSKVSSNLDSRLVVANLPGAEADLGRDASPAQVLWEIKIASECFRPTRHTEPRRRTYEWFTANPDLPLHCVPILTSIPLRTDDKGRTSHCQGQTQLQRQLEDAKAGPDPFQLSAQIDGLLLLELNNLATGHLSKDGTCKLCFRLHPRSHVSISRRKQIAGNFEVVARSFPQVRYVYVLHELQPVSPLPGQIYSKIPLPSSGG